MVRLWSEEVGDARSVIEPLIKQVDPAVRIEMDGEEGFRKDTVEVRLQKAEQKALCIVTFEAWVNAKTDPAEMKKALQEIVAEMEGGKALPTYLLTSQGLNRQPEKKDIEILRDIAASSEADALAEQFPKRLRH